MSSLLSGNQSNLGRLGEGPLLGSGDDETTQAPRNESVVDLQQHLKRSVCVEGRERAVGGAWR